MKINISALTDTGVIRDHNEDNFIVSPDLTTNNWYLTDKLIKLSSKGSLLVLADGMGGTNAGEIASAIAVDTIKKFFSELKIVESISESKAKDILKKSIVLAHDEIVNQAKNNPAYQGMGTTIIVAWILKDTAIISWCGDSRGYLFRKNEGLKIITKDHSLVWEMVKSGRLTPEEADLHPDNNIITQSLGDGNSIPKPDFTVQKLIDKDILLLCSDGLNNMISSEIISTIISQDKPIIKINKDLIDAANKNGGHDNITVVLLQVYSDQPIIEKKNGNKLLFTSLLILFMALLTFGGAIFLINKNSTTILKKQKISTHKKTLPKRQSNDLHDSLKSDYAQIDTLQKKSVESKKNETDKNLSPTHVIDTIHEISIRINKMDLIVKNWNLLSNVLDSIQDHQSQRHIDTIKTSILFELINRQREFDEYLSKFNFVQKIDEWKSNKKNERITLSQYDINAMDEIIKNAHVKYGYIQKSVGKIVKN